MEQIKADRSIRDRIGGGVERMKSIASSRRGFVNELNFTYQRLRRLLPALIRRLDADELIGTLRSQNEEDVRIHERLVEVVSAHGEAPQPCLCEEANAVVEEVYHADRMTAHSDKHDDAILRALRSTRLFLIQLWAKLLDTISPDTLPEYRKEVRRLQHREGEMHRTLVRLEQRMNKE